jgi:cytochrome c
MLYESRCIACHSIESNRVGPRHRGVFGRRAGALEDYDYSAAVAGSEIVWDAAALDRWLEKPEALIPGQRMNIQVAAPVDRADIIAYLKEES